jgi:hypothetical protein
MNPRLEASLRVQLDRLRPFVDAARARRFWIKCGLVCLLAMGATGTLGRSALARTAALRGEAARLDEVRAGLERWRREGVIASDAEIVHWRASAVSLASMDSAAAEPLLVARRVAGRAERVRVADLSIRMASGDTLGAGPPLQMGSWTVSAGETGLLVEFTSGVAEIVSFLGALPPQVEVAGIDVSAAGDALRTRLALRLLHAEGPS